MSIQLQITCRDPIIARDGRPFGAGQSNRMRGLPWLLPSVVAGSLRTALGKEAKRDFSEIAQELLTVEVSGALPCTDQELYLPAPHDCVAHRGGRVLRARPQPLEQGGCDWPEAGLLPVLLPGTEEGFKPASPPAWWPSSQMARWLQGQDVSFDDTFLDDAESVERTHVKLDAASGAAAEGDLFTTAALVLSHLPRHARPKPVRPQLAAITLAARVRAEGWCKEAAGSLDALHPLGGERRLAHWKAGGPDARWRCPQPLRPTLVGALRVRMVLATPALFSSGWRPGWLDQQLIGKAPGTTLVLRLLGVSIERWRAVSGWSLAQLPGQPRGPKPVRRMVPAGGVYFFEVVDGDAAQLAGRWLESVSDDDQDQRNGFGLATWGIW